MTNECIVSVVVVGELPGKHLSFITAYKTVYREDSFFNFSTKTLFLFFSTMLLCPNNEFST